MPKRRKRAEPDVARGAALYTLIFALAVALALLVSIWFTAWDAQAKYSATLSAVALVITVAGLLGCVLGNK